MFERHVLSLTPQILFIRLKWQPGFDDLCLKLLGHSDWAQKFFGVGFSMNHLFTVASWMATASIREFSDGSTLRTQLLESTTTSWQIPRRQRVDQPERPLGPLGSGIPPTAASGHKASGKDVCIKTACGSKQCIPVYPH